MFLCAHRSDSHRFVLETLQGHMQSVIQVYLQTHQFHLRGLIGNHHSETQECHVSCWQCKCLSFNHKPVALLSYPVSCF